MEGEGSGFSVRVERLRHLGWSWHVAPVGGHDAGGETGSDDDVVGLFLHKVNPDLSNEVAGLPGQEERSELSSTGESVSDFATVRESGGH